MFHVKHLYNSNKIFPGKYFLDGIIWDKPKDFQNFKKMIRTFNIE